VTRFTGVRLVLIAAVLATVATSAPRNFEIELRTAMAPMQNTATIVPDDLAIAPETLVVSAGLTDRSYQLLAVCTRDEDCDAGVSIDVAFQP
jgi:hypothetical protein